MVGIKSKDNFSWTRKSDSTTTVSISKIVTDMRRLQRLLLISLNALDREDLKALKKDIVFLENAISDGIEGREVPSNIIRDYDHLKEDVREKVSDIDKRILG